MNDLSRVNLFSIYLSNFSRRPKVTSTIKPVVESGQPEGKSDLQTFTNSASTTTTTTNTNISSRCKSDSTEPFSTPEPCSPSESLLVNPGQTKVRRQDAITTATAAVEQSTSLRFPNLLAG